MTERDNELDVDRLDSEYINVPDEPEDINFDHDDGQDSPPDLADETTPAVDVPKKHDRAQKRINDLTREKHELRERAAAAETKLYVLQTQMHKINESSTAVAAQTLAEREADLMARKKEAINAGDFDAYDRLSEEIYAVRRKVEQFAARPPAPDPLPEQEKIPESKRDIHPAAQEWLDNNEWINDPVNSHLVAEAEVAEARLLRSGIPIGPALYKKLDAELLRLPEFSGLIKADSGPPRSVVAPPTRGGVPPQPPQQGRLTDQDKAIMRRHGLDANDPEIRAMYLSRKRG